MREFDQIIDEFPPGLQKELSLVAQDGKESACNAGDPGSISGSGRSPGERNGTSLQYSCLENSMDGGAWWSTVHGVAESDRPKQLTVKDL